MCSKEFHCSTCLQHKAFSICSGENTTLVYRMQLLGVTA